MDKEVEIEGEIIEVKIEEEVDITKEEAELEEVKDTINLKNQIMMINRIIMSKIGLLILR
jgi:hypothetical protein